ncbi:hypothetical protein Cpir12675_000317 [Ceratocystis pirilliformis]|uniref:Uncharacterized protein n=1 Tax=Ceratocystis pirilliformis TaxID=259994 RepID=A0ABR3ZMY4_9PEZI
MNYDPQIQGCYDDGLGYDDEEVDFLGEICRETLEQNRIMSLQEEANKAAEPRSLPNSGDTVILDPGGDTTAWPQSQLTPVKELEEPSPSMTPSSSHSQTLYHQQNGETNMSAYDQVAGDMLQTVPISPSPSHCVSCLKPGSPKEPTEVSPVELLQESLTITSHPENKYKLLGGYPLSLTMSFNGLHRPPQTNNNPNEYALSAHNQSTPCPLSSCPSTPLNPRTTSLTRLLESIFDVQSQWQLNVPNPSRSAPGRSQGPVPWISPSLAETPFVVPSSFAERPALMPTRFIKLVCSQYPKTIFKVLTDSPVIEPWARVEEVNADKDLDSDRNGDSGDSADDDPESELGSISHHSYDSNESRESSFFQCFAYMPPQPSTSTQPTEPKPLPSWYVWAQRGQAAAV